MTTAKFITVKELCEMLHVTPQYVYEHRKDIPHVRLGTGKNSSIRFNEEEVMEWLKKNKYCGKI